MSKELTRQRRQMHISGIEKIKFETCGKSDLGHHKVIATREEKTIV